MPRWNDYPAGPTFQGKLAAPRIVTREQRTFRTTLRQAITLGYSVTDGGTEHERRGVNFAGHYVLVQWGCGSNCMEAALIDGVDGSVLRLPQIAGEALSYYGLPTGSADLRTVEFRVGSRLLGIPRVADGKTYYYVLNGRSWKYVQRVSTPPGHD